MAGARFLLAGGALYAFMRRRGEPAPLRKHWGTTAAIGALLLLLGNGGVVLAERTVPPGVVELRSGWWLHAAEFISPPVRRARHPRRTSRGCSSKPRTAQRATTVRSPTIASSFPAVARASIRTDRVDSPAQARTLASCCP
jgi:hypothetical protein